MITKSEIITGTKTELKKYFKAINSLSKDNQIDITWKCRKQDN